MINKKMTLNRTVTILGIIVVAIIAIIAVSASFRSGFEALDYKQRAEQQVVQQSQQQAVDLQAQQQAEQNRKQAEQQFQQQYDTMKQQIQSNKPNPYCDKVSDEYMRSGGICHDRYDISDTTGLATCNDGSHRADPENCPDATETTP
jgi:membrane-associated HD superfamily phosphohydrolase